MSINKIQRQVAALREIVAEHVSDLGIFDIAAPPVEDFHVIFDGDDGSYSVEVEVGIGSGLVVPLNYRVEHSRSTRDISAAASAIRTAIASAWERRDEMASKLGELRRRAPGMFEAARAEGVEIELLGVGIATVYLHQAQFDRLDVEVRYELLNGHTLRRAVTRGAGGDADVIEAQLGTMTEVANERNAQRADMIAAGVAGRIGDVALHFVDTFAEKRSEVLRRLARGEYVGGYQPDEDGTRWVIQLRKGQAILKCVVNRDVSWEWDRFHLNRDVAKAARPGATIGELIDDPLVQPGLVVTEVGEDQGRVTVAVAQSDLIFDMSGRILG